MQNRSPLCPSAQELGARHKGGTSSRARAGTSLWVALLLQSTLTPGLFCVARFVSAPQGEPGSCSHSCAS